MADWKTSEDVGATLIVFIAHLRPSKQIGSDGEICAAKKNQEKKTVLTSLVCSSRMKIRPPFSASSASAKPLASWERDGGKGERHQKKKKINTECHEEVTGEAGRKETRKAPPKVRG